MMPKGQVLSVIGGLALAVAAIQVDSAVGGEYKWWHHLIGAQAKNQKALGWGEGVRVGVIDGLARWDHHEFGGRLDRSWISWEGFYFDPMSPNRDHGTHVAGIIGAARDKNRTKMAGVAPLVNISNVAVLDDFGWAPGATTRAALRQVARDGATIANLSYGPNCRVFPSLCGLLAFNDDLEAISRHNDNLVITKSAGNASPGNAGINLQTISWDTDEKPLDNMIIVGSVNRNKSLSGFSNKPGAGCFRKPGKRCQEADRYWNRFLAAPGGGILSTLASQPYGVDSGTSMAAPMVAGAAALLQSNWPFLKSDPKTTVDILLDTAEDIGSKRRFGRGLLRIDRAMMPQGTRTLAVGAEVQGPGHATHDSAIRVPSAVGSGSTIAKHLEGVVFFDRYARDFAFNPQSLVLNAPTAALSLEHRLSAGANTQHEVLAAPVASGIDAEMTFIGVVRKREVADAFEVAPELARDWSRFGSRFDDNPMWRMQGEVGAVTFGFGQRMGLAQDVAPATPDHLFLFDAAGALQPLTALGDQAAHGFVGYRFTDRLGIGAGFAEMQRDDPFIEAGETGIGRAYLVRAEIEPIDRVALQLTQTLVTESNMVLGGVSSGALALGSSATTTASGAAVTLDLPSSFTARLHYTHATTAISGGAPTLFREVGPLYSRAFGGSLTRRGVLLGADDELGLTISKPLHVYSGTALLETPVGRTVDGRVQYRRSRISLAPEGSQTDIELGYRARLAPSLSVGVNLFHQHQLDNQVGESNSGGLMRGQLTF